MSIYGPPETGKTLTTRRVCQEFAACHDALAIEYVNLEECRTLFSAANEILFELIGERKGAYEGLDGVFKGIWTALEAYPEYTIFVLDEIDHVAQDSNYDANEFFYRLLRGEGKLKRDITLSVFLLSNELLEVDLRLDSRVQSAMSGEDVFFPPYGIEELAAVVRPRLNRAFRDGALSDDVQAYGVRQAASRWGDARKTLTLFRHAGETANEQRLTTVTTECIEDNFERTDRTATIEKLTRLPLQHLFVLDAITGWVQRGTGEVEQPVTTTRIHEAYDAMDLPDSRAVGERARRDCLTELETMGLLNTWIESKGREGRVKLVETTFDPSWVDDALTAAIDRHTNVD